MTNKPAMPRDSASVLIIRDGESHPRHGCLQILMVKRHHNIKFAGGAYVFPGGKLDPADRLSENNADAVPADFRGFRHAALREVFEETGLLIGTRHGQPVSEAMRRKLDEEFRPAIIERQITLANFLDRSGICFDRCRPFARWITPKIYPLRYDTRFFLCLAPAGQIPSPDGHEITAVQWMHPMTLVEESDGILMFPTMMNLKKLGQAKSVAEAFERLAKRDIVTVTPEVITGDKARFRKIPDAAGYDDVDQSRTRTAIDINRNPDTSR
ncbi:MAG: NUDIX domain-containing protein [Alphaproteobacteria bacterium]|nr:NUDIX domain-containing protein [Alphaproteobacteria bacterium]